SAPKSPTRRACGVTSSSSTPNASTSAVCTFENTSSLEAIVGHLLRNDVQKWPSGKQAHFPLVIESSCDGRATHRRSFSVCPTIHLGIIGCAIGNVDSHCKVAPAL